MPTLTDADIDAALTAAHSLSPLDTDIDAALNAATSRQDTSTVTLRTPEQNLAPAFSSAGPVGSFNYTPSKLLALPSLDPVVQGNEGKIFEELDKQKFREEQLAYAEAQQPKPENKDIGAIEGTKQAVRGITQLRTQRGAAAIGAGVGGMIEGLGDDEETKFLAKTSNWFGNTYRKAYEELRDAKTAADLHAKADASKTLLALREGRAKRLSLTRRATPATLPRFPVRHLRRRVRHSRRSPLRGWTRLIRRKLSLTLTCVTAWGIRFLPLWRNKFLPLLLR
jgi:hypothetical protein